MSAASEHYRLFVAIPVPAEVRTVVAEAQADLRRVTREAQIRWTQPEQFHLTLRFLGDVAAGRIEELSALLGAVCLGHAPMALRAERMGFFPDARQPRVAWVGLGGDIEALEGLWKRILQVTHSFAKEEEDRDEFAAHVTLGRIKFIRPAERQAMVATAAHWSQHNLGEWTATAVWLMRSKLTAMGAEHKRLAEFPFARSAGAE